GTAALHVACLAAGIGSGDEVITTSITFAASANCVCYCGATPVFADIDPITYNIDWRDVERKITPKTKAIIPVHFAGQPCDMEELHRLAEENSLLIIEDGAHALGAEYKGEKIGALSDMTTFSFHPVKHITTGEGGMVTTNNESLYQRLLLFRSHGITRDRAFMKQTQGGWYYQQLELGYNYRISDIQCALGISQMKRLPEFLRKRRQIAERYNRELSGLEGVVLPVQREETNSSWHLYVIQLTKRERGEAFDILRRAGIGVNVHYLPVYQHPYYQNHGYREVHCINAEELYGKILSIPIFPGLTEKEQTYVIENIRKL
ncbi:MAG: UDP-4-amino-4,6-dideoxy-N-acetyl-beta-L-altrosamine transaminase, partial [Acetivibrio ethanolgignens]